jgi:hypothetical protein
MNVLRVFPNPFSARDKTGAPCGVCPRDPESDGGGPGQFVGARLDRGNTKVLQKLKKGDDIRSPMQRTAYEFLGVSALDPELAAKLMNAEPIEVPRTKYYRDRIAEGSLIAADEATARVAKGRFVEPKAFFARYVVAPVAAPAVEAEPVTEPVTEAPVLELPAASEGSEAPVVLDAPEGAGPVYSIKRNRRS